MHCHFPTSSNVQSGGQSNLPFGLAKSIKKSLSSFPKLQVVCHDGMATKQQMKNTLLANKEFALDRRRYFLACNQLAFLLQMTSTAEAIGMTTTTAMSETVST